MVQKSRITEMQKNTDSKNKGKAVKKHASAPRVAKPSTDSKLEALDQKWSERFSRLEAMLLFKSFIQPEPVFQPVVVSPAKPPPASAVDNTQPFFEPQLADRPSTTH